MLDGLNKQEIDYRIDNNLINNEDIKNSRSIKTIFISNIITLFNFIHIVLLVLVLTTGQIANTTFIIAIIFNTIISIYQEIKAKRIIDKLKLTNTNKICVIREGKKIDILPSEILLDDLLYLKQGDSLVVDARIIKANALEVDESIITGESDSIQKKDDEMLISGSIITAGEGFAKVTSINRNTYANNLISEASKTKDDSSYLMNCINTILKVVTFLIIPVGLLLFITQHFYSGQNYVESILSTVAGIIGMIPDGLVLLTSISLTVGVIKMASDKVIIQKLSGIELLACVDILCLDKTGTITDGSMEVIKVINKDNRVDINNIIAGLANENGNMTDKALTKYFGNKSTLELIKKIPFSSQRKYSQAVFDKGSYAIGALEYLTNHKIEEYPELNEYLEKGYRILTLVKCNEKFNKSDNKILSFIILKDNIRNNAKTTLEYFKDQNVKVKIISGDNPITVSNILKQLEIEDYDKYIGGQDLPEDYNELKKIVNDYVIYGRVTPYQKQLIVKALKENNTVGYIGDGVNDILALKEADCGIALASGISAARSVSEVVLTNSDFAVLPKIVNEGRRVINNIERVASMYLIKTVYSFLISLTCIILSHEYPFYPIQLSLISAICVWLNIFFLIMISYIFKLDFDIFRLTIVAVTGYLNLRLLYNISKPLTFLRKILVYSCFIAFYALLFIYRKLLLINKINFWTILFIIIIILANNYITEFLENIYDKFKEFIKKKRSRSKREKK